MIQLTTVLQQIDKELQQAQQTNNDLLIRQKLAAIKALCELTEQSNQSIALTPQAQPERISSQEMLMMTGQLSQEEVPQQDNLLDF